MFTTQFGFRPRKCENPQSTLSITMPNQAPSLRYILGVIQSGGSLNCRLPMSYDNSASLDDPTFKDTKHLSVSDIDNVLSSFSTVNAESSPSTDTSAGA